MDKETVFAQVVAALAEITSHAAEDFQPETKLFDGGLDLNSFATVELISQMEEQYNFEFSDVDFIPENFVSLAALCSVIETYLPRVGQNAAR